MERKVLKKRLVLKKSVRKFITQTLITIIIVLITLISIKKTPSLKQKITKKVYEENIGFMKMRNLYNKYFGDILPFTNLFVEDKETKAVFGEQISYKSKENYKEGVKLVVGEDYLVPALKEGIVVFIGEKEDYGNTVIVEQTDGTDVFYSNLETINVNLYDYIEKGFTIGEVKDNTLYLLFQKEGNIIDYQKFI